MSSEDPYVRLPDHIELSLAEASRVLEVLDVAAATARTDEERAAVADVARMITVKLWRELGDLLNGGEKRSLMAMTTKLMEGGLRSPEAAKRLGIRGRDAYMLMFEGELDGGPGRDGMVYFDEASIDAYLERYGFGVVAGSSTGSSTGSSGTSPHEAPPASRPKARKRTSEAPNDTEQNRRSSGTDHS